MMKNDSASLILYDKVSIAEHREGQCDCACAYIPCSDVLPLIEIGAQLNSSLKIS